MATIGASGLLVSDVHLLILAHWLLDTGKAWAAAALDGMISKAQSTIEKDWLERYFATQTGSVSTDPAVLMPAILAMAEFTPYNIPTPAVPDIDCGRTKDQQLWPDGFTIEDYELAILNAYYVDPDAYLRYLMLNKIYQRGMKMIEQIRNEWIGDPQHQTMPACMADSILAYTSEEGYLNRVQREAQE